MEEEEKTFKHFKDIKDHCNKWRSDSVDFWNENIAEKSELDQRVLITRIQTLEQDVKQSLAYIEVLAELCDKQ